jgi:hypothetical protein
MFNYTVVTSNGSGDGMVEATSKAEALQVLTEQYAPADHRFVDSEGNPVIHELVSIELIEVQQ